jgi:hypothetical protein
VAGELGELGVQLGDDRLLRFDLAMRSSSPGAACWMRSMASMRRLKLRRRSRSWASSCAAAALFHSSSSPSADS